METETLRQRKPVQGKQGIDQDVGGTAVTEHPGGDVKHGGPKQLLRLLLVAVYFISSCIS
jgi:hypothetical protein